jgi:ElaB/YqjD/DUF883 family membrane-anchored ribosome-binding protein
MATSSPTHDVQALLERLRVIIETAKPLPLSASVRVDRDELLELLDLALTRLPDELKQARWLLKEREEFLAKSQREADDIVDAARTRAERMVQRTEIVREAERVAQSIVDAAQQRSSQMRHEAEDYIDQKLASFEIVLERTLQVVGRGRERLGLTVTPQPIEEEDELPMPYDQDVGQVAQPVPSPGTQSMVAEIEHELDVG